MGKFVVPKIGDGNCLFLAVSYCFYNGQDKNHDLKLEIVTEILNQ